MRLIDADALKDWLTKQTGFRANCEDCIDDDCIDCIVKEAIDNSPTVDAIKYGEWIGYLDGDSIMPERYYQCSECGSRGYRKKYNYCAVCGAKNGR